MDDRAYNFGAGPAMLPFEVLKKIQRELFDWRGTGVSILELGHRTPVFENFLKLLQDKIRKIMQIPLNYKILFMHGGAQTQFVAVPMNLVRNNVTVDYFVTGVWSRRALDFAQKYAKVNVVTEVSNYKISEPDSWQLNPNACYAYYCANETVDGVSFDKVPEVGNVPLVVDMTSNIMAAPIDVSKFGIIFASAQKNLGVAGITLVIVRDDLLEQSLEITPPLLNYKQLDLTNSLLNTPNVFAIYVLDLMMDWIESQGGVASIAQINARKSEKLYDFIDNSLFYYNKVDKKSRSSENVTFDLVKPELLSEFLALANEVGLKYLKGHRLVGGARASLYNAMPESGVDKLIEFMEQFSKKYKVL